MKPVYPARTVGKLTRRLQICNTGRDVCDQGGLSVDVEQATGLAGKRRYEEEERVEHIQADEDQGESAHESAFAGWTFEHLKLDSFPAPGGTVKRVCTIAARRRSGVE